MKVFLIFLAWSMVSGARIECDLTTKARRGNATMASVQIEMDDGDLLSMDTLVVHGLLSLINNTQKDDVSSSVATTTVFDKDKVASRSTADGKSDEMVWHGSLQGTAMGYATLVHAETGELSGSFTTPQAAYSIVTMPSGDIQIRATRWSEFPDIDAVDDEKKHPSTKHAFRNITDTSGIAADATFFPDCSSRFTQRGLQRSEARYQAPLNLRQLQQQETTSVVDVMVIVTNTAYCEYAGLERGCQPTDANTSPIRSRMPVIQEQTNNAFAQVDIAVETRIVEVIMLEGTFDGGPSANTLDILISDRNVNQWRQDVGADLVAMITGSDRFTCGIAYLNTHVSATSYSCLDSYTYTHELGHNFGANHDRDNVFVRQQHQYGHGFRAQGQYRTVMAYNCPGGGCAQVPIFSANGYTLDDGRSLGDAQHDNARLINENAPRIAAFADTVIPLDAGTSSPSIPNGSTTAAPVTAPVTATTFAPSITPATTTTTATALTCPLGSSNVCPEGTNLLSRGRRRRRCRQTCATESRLYVWFVFGFRCGPCQ